MSETLVLTETGRDMLSQAGTLGPVQLSHMAFGDGTGAADKTRAELRNERLRVEADGRHNGAGRVGLLATVPPQAVGPWAITEMGLIGTQNNASKLFAYWSAADVAGALATTDRAAETMVAAEVTLDQDDSAAVTVTANVAVTFGDFFPPGVIVDYGGAAAPAGWLLCDGRAVSRTTYARLFGAIGAAFGPGDGSATFNLPDFRRRAAVGAGGIGTTELGSAVGDAGGEEEHTLTVGETAPHLHNASSDEAPAHLHGSGTLATDTHVEADHSHALPLAGGGTLALSHELAEGAHDDERYGTPNTGLAGGFSHDHDVSGSTSSAGNHKHAITIANAGGGEAHNNLPPSLVVNKIVKT